MTYNNFGYHVQIGKNSRTNLSNIQCVHIIIVAYII